MMLHVDTSSPVPPYEQMRSQIEGLIESGALATGTRLPTIRQLAHDLGLAPGTVARVYRELEEGRLIVTRGRRGTFIAAAEDVSAQRNLARLSEAARSFAREARRLGVDPAAAERAVRNALIADGS
jgi:GntR family transcriptional regulator